MKNMMKMSMILAVVVMIFATSCKNANKQGDKTNNESQTEMNTGDAMMESNQKKVVVNLKGMEGSDITGEVVFVEENGKVTMTATVRGMAEGTHAIHIHENADCSSMEAAGGHWNPTNEPHGKWGSEDGFHRGDIGNFEVGADGTGSITLTTDLWCIGCEDSTKNILGHSIIVHEGVDDFTSQPSGAAGARMACGPIVQ